MLGLKRKVPETELEKLVKYAKKQGIAVKFVDSKILKDYAGMNPEAAEAMGFPDYDGDKQTKEILIDRTLPEETQTRNLKHELVEMRLMQKGMKYWEAHEIALGKEREPFDYKPIKAVKAKVPEPSNKQHEPQRKHKVRKYKRKCSVEANPTVQGIKK